MAKNHEPSKKGAERLAEELKLDIGKHNQKGYVTYTPEYYYVYLWQLEPFKVQQKPNLLKWEDCEIIYQICKYFKDSD